MKLKNGLAILLATSACFAFVACEEEPAPAPAPHEHTWATEWTKDSDNHWHACTGEDCEEINEKAAHEWNAGEITAQPSASADGVKTYTCTVCSQTKTEAVAYVVDTEVTAEEWLAALSFANEDNYKIVSVSGLTAQTVEFDGVSVHFTVYMGGQLQMDGYSTKDGDKYYAVDGQTGKKQEETKAEYDNARGMGFDMTFAYSDFTYDPTSKTYKADEIVIDFGDMMTTYSDVKITFENKRVVKMTYTASNDYLGEDTGEVTITYDTVQTIAVPTNTVDETQMLAAFADAKNDAISKRVTFSLGGDTMVFITNADKYSYSMPNLSEYVFVTDGLKIYNRAYDEGTGAWEAWTVSTSNSETSFLQTYEYMHKPNLFLKDYAPTSFASMTQAQDGGYEYTIAGNNDYDSYKVYFVGGKLTKFVAYDGSDAYTLVYEYGDYTVEIPQV